MKKRQTVRESNNLPESVAGHRVDYWTWIESNADPASRDTLLTLRDHWRDYNSKFFDGRMLEPYITLTEPSAPQRNGQCCPKSSWGSRLEIRLRPSLLAGTHPHTCDMDAAGRLYFVHDVILHEMIHQHIMEHEPDVDESSYHGHGPVFAAHCNRIGALLGLPEVVVRNRGGKKLPLPGQWPHCVRPDADDARQPKPVTARAVSIPVGYHVSVIDPQMVDGKAFLHIGFDPASGDSPPIELRLEVDTAYELADLILDDTTEGAG